MDYTFKIRKLFLQQFALLALMATATSADKRPSYHQPEPSYHPTERTYAYSAPSPSYHSEEKEVGYYIGKIGHYLTVDTS